MRGAPTKVVCAECKKMCSLGGGKNSRGDLKQQKSLVVYVFVA